MSLDLERLWHRNMGRDDRAISHNAKEARFPFLDRKVQAFLKNVVPEVDPNGNSHWLDLNLPRG